MAKVPDYTKRAIDKYHAKFDRLTVSLPKEYKPIIADSIGLSVNQYVNQLIQDDLIKRGLLPAAAENDITKNSDFNDEEMPFN